MTSIEAGRFYGPYEDALKGLDEAVKRERERAWEVAGFPADLASRSSNRAKRQAPRARCASSTVPILPVSSTRFQRRSSALFESRFPCSLKSSAIHRYEQRHAISWQARVTGSWRFYFRIEDDAYQALTIHSHPK